METRAWSVLSLPALPQLQNPVHGKDFDTSTLTPMLNPVPEGPEQSLASAA